MMKKVCYGTAKNLFHSNQLTLKFLNEGLYLITTENGKIGLCKRGYGPPQFTTDFGNIERKPLKGSRTSVTNGVVNVNNSPVIKYQRFKTGLLKWNTQFISVTGQEYIWHQEIISYKNNENQLFGFTNAKEELLISISHIKSKKNIEFEFFLNENFKTNIDIIALLYILLDHYFRAILTDLPVPI